MNARRPERQDHRLEALMATALHRHMGIAPVDPNDRSAGITFEVDAALVNNSGMLHGGLVATSLDVASAYTIFPELSDDDVVLTNSFSISYLRPIPRGSTVVARATLTRRGSATAFLNAEVLVEDVTMATAQVVKSIVSLGTFS